MSLTHYLSLYIFNRVTGVHGDMGCLWRPGVCRESTCRFITLEQERYYTIAYLDPGLSLFPLPPPHPPAPTKLLLITALLYISICYIVSLSVSL